MEVHRKVSLSCYFFLWQESWSTYLDITHKYLLMKDLSITNAKILDVNVRILSRKFKPDVQVFKKVKVSSLSE